jgi:hypothetical protein
MQHHARDFHGGQERLSLGHRGICCQCTEHLQYQCRVANGRLPSPSEAYCPRCRALRPLSRMCQPEKGGRQRLECRTCRRREGAAAKALRVARGTGVARRLPEMSHCTRVHA